jgi:hypothetical protein
LNLIEYVLAAERRRPAVGRCNSELLQDITDAARAIGAIVQPLALSRRA